MMRPILPGAYSTKFSAGAKELERDLNGGEKAKATHDDGISSDSDKGVKIHRSEFILLCLPLSLGQMSYFCCKLT